MNKEGIVKEKGNSEGRATSTLLRKQNQHGSFNKKSMELLIASQKDIKAGEATLQWAPESEGLDLPTRALFLMYAWLKHST